PVSTVDAARAGRDGARGEGTAQQADSGGDGDERGLRQGAPAARHGEDASRLGGGPGPDGRPGRPTQPKVVAAFTKVKWVGLGCRWIICRHDRAPSRAPLLRIGKCRVASQPPGSGSPIIQRLGGGTWLASF